MNPVIVISEQDNVATALEALEPGQVVDHNGRAVNVRETIPRGHKVALTAIAAGHAVIKYGSSIGTATIDISPGAHVHTHNVSSERGRGDLAASLPQDGRIAEPPDDRRNGE
ncbi:MAG TPA: UxaA family hydrolase [Vicinamibacterales bacterium]